MLSSLQNLTSMQLKPLFCAGILILLSSCGPVFESEVTRFHKLPKKGNSETFYVVAPRKAPGLETEQHLAELSAGLKKYGWVEGDPKSATYKVGLDYGISNGRTVHGVAPIFGQTSPGGTTYHSGTASAYGSGGYASGSYSGTSYTPATYGVVGAVPTTSTVFDRYLFVIALDRNKKSVLDVTCYSSGSSSNLSLVVPKMIKSVLTDFPGKSGETKTYRSH